MLEQTFRRNSKVWWIHAPQGREPTREPSPATVVRTNKLTVRIYVHEAGGYEVTLDPSKLILRSDTTPDESVATSVDA